MTTVKATCPYCGDVELTPKQIRLRVCNVQTMSTYEFTCNTCGELVTKPAGRDVCALLISGGVLAEPWSIPRELLEEHNGPVIDYDYLLDWHNLLSKLEPDFDLTIFAQPAFSQVSLSDLS